MRKFRILLLLLLTFSMQLFAQAEWRAYKSGNYVYFENKLNGQLIEGGLSTIEFRKLLASDTAYRIFKNGIDQLNDTIFVGNIEDVNGIIFTSVTFERFKEINTGASQDIFIQDQHSPIIIAYFSLLEQETLLTNNVDIDDYDITVDVVTGFTAGKYVSIFNVAANRFYLGTILSVSVNTLTMDTPMDFAYPAGSFVTAGERSMDVDGSTTPVIFGLRNTDVAIGSAFDITRIIFTCTTTNPVDLSKFGDIVSGLTNGLVLRKKDDIYRNIFNVKTNQEISNLMFDFNAQTATNPAQGQDGFVARMTFGGQNKMGVTIRLEPGEDLELMVQDNLTTILSLFVIAEGHTVVD